MKALVYKLLQKLTVFTCITLTWLAFSVVLAKPATAKPKNLKAVTFNFNGFFKHVDKRSKLLAHELTTIKPHVVALQEITRTAWRKIKPRIRRTLPYCTGGFKLMLCSKYRMSRIVKKSYRASTRRDRKYYRRGFVKATIRVNRRYIHIYTTHLTWKLEHQRVRERQLDELVRFARKHSRRRSVLILGDFNSSSNSEDYGLVAKVSRIRINGRPLIDTYREVNPIEQGYTWSMENPKTWQYSEPDRRVDFIFLIPFGRLEVVESRLVFEQPYPGIGFLSDHFGVLSVIRIPRA